MRMTFGGRSAAGDGLASARTRAAGYASLVTYMRDMVRSTPSAGLWRSCAGFRIFPRVSPGSKAGHFFRGGRMGRALLPVAVWLCVQAGMGTRARADVLSAGAPNPGDPGLMVW